MSSSFADLGVPAQIGQVLQARGLTSAFPIQALAIPPALAGQDICGRAPTGSGKTIAFGVPLAARVGKGRPGHPQALVLSPTRELASQIEVELVHLLKGGRRRVAAFYGGVGFGSQLGALRRGVDVVVACPGRLKDLIERGAMSLSEVSIVVIDEADRLADMGFLPEVKKILDQVRPDRQTLLFSATLDGDVDSLIRRYQRAPVHVSVEADETELSTVHHWLDARREERVTLAADLVASHGPTIVFCRTKHGTDRVAKQLAASGVKAVSLHGGRTQSQRERALHAFATGRAHALVATDVAARGIHVDGVSCVIHFDLPTTAKDYVHRSGRTGRAGAEGVVVSFVTPTDGAAVRVLQKALGQPTVAQSGAEKSGRPGHRRPGPPPARRATDRLRRDHGQQQRGGQSPTTAKAARPRPGNAARFRRRSRAA